MAGVGPDLTLVPKVRILRRHSGYPPGMQLPMTPPLVLAVLLTAGPAATDATPEPPSTSPQPTVDTVASTNCPAYLGPQCDSSAHERWADGQALADSALHAHRHAA